MNPFIKGLLSLALIPALITGSIYHKPAISQNNHSPSAMYTSHSDHAHSMQHDILTDRSYPSESSLCPYNHTAPSGFIYQGCSAGTTSSLPDPTHDALRILSIAMALFAPYYISIPLAVIVELLGNDYNNQGPTIYTFTYIYNGYPVMYYHEVYALYVNGTYHYLTCQTEQIISQFVPE